MRRFASALAAWLLVLPLTLSAQEPSAIEPGSRLRITAPSLGIDRESATFGSLTDDTLTVVTDSIVSCPLSALTRLELYRGHVHHPWRGAGVGFVVGALVGAIIGSENAAKWDLPTSDAALVGAGFCGLIGAGVGALFGTSIVTDRWETIPLGQLRVQPVATVDARFGLGVSLRI